MSDKFLKLESGINVGSLPGDPSNGQAGDEYFNSTTLKKRFHNGISWKNVGTGTGGGGSGLALVPNGDAEDGVAYPFIAFANTPANIPVNGLAGTPVSTLVVNSTNPLAGEKDFLFSKPASNQQGEGWSVDFKIDNKDRGKLLTVQLSYLTSGAFVTGQNSDMQFFIYDITNAVLVPFDQRALYYPSGDFKARFYASSISGQYRLIGFVATTSVLAWTIEFDNVSFGNSDTTFIAAGEDRQVIAGATIAGQEGSYGSGTNHINPTLSFIAAATARYRIYVAGTGQYSTAEVFSYVNVVSGTPTIISQSQTITAGAGIWTPIYIELIVDLIAGQSYSFETLLSVNSGTAYFFANAPMIAEQLTPDVKPIALSSKIWLSQIISQGTQVTGRQPSALGEYRALYNTGANTFSDASGYPAPTVVNGLRTYTGLYPTAGSATQPSVYYAFVGFNKVIKGHGWGGTNHFPELDTSKNAYSGDEWGGAFIYNPNTGILSINFGNCFAATTLHVFGTDNETDPTAAQDFNDGFTDVEISDNPIGLGYAGFVGQILDMASEIAPPGTLECNGAAVSRATYGRLFAVIGTAFGAGDGTTTFNVPPSGVFYRSWDHGLANDPDAATRTALNGGATGDHVGSYQADQLGPNPYYLPAVDRSLNQEYAGSPSSVTFGLSFTASGTTETRPRNVNIMKVIVY